MKFYMTILTAFSALFFAQTAATTIVLEDNMSLVNDATGPDTPLYELIHSMLDTLDKKKKNKKKSGKINVETGVTAHASSGLNPEMVTPDQAAYMAGALLDSYNEIHLADDYDGLEAQFVNDGMDEDAELSAEEDLDRKRVPRPRSFRAWYRFSFDYSCRLCGDDLAMDFLTNAGMNVQDYVDKSSKRQEWEQRFCEKLQHCPFEELRDAKGCKIEMDHGVNAMNA